MSISRKLVLLGLVSALLTSLLAPLPASAWQNPATSSGTAPAAPPAAGKPQAPGTAAPQSSGKEERETLTGDWDGVRTGWQDNGVTVDSSLTQFFQGVAWGGRETGSEYNATLQTTLEFDLGKMAGWENWSSEVKAEWRFGGPLLTGTGSINPVNTAAMIPGTEGSKFAITAANLTRLFPINLKEGRLVAVSFGRYNTIDLLDEEFFAGGGIERFFNIAQIGPLTVLRQIPLVTNGASFAYIRAGKPFFTFAVMDPNDHSLDPGLSDLFEDGVTFSPGLILRATHFGRSAKHSFGGAITTKEYTPFDAIRQVIIPGPALVPIDPQAGSWSVNYVFRQYIVERAEDDGWGVFSQVSFADRATSPITTFFDIGLGGNGVFDGRPRDEFGLAYAYTDLSQDLKDNLNLLTLGGQPVRSEHQVELFYNLHLLPWLQLTADLQIIRPTLSSADTATVPGVRLRVVF